MRRTATAPDAISGMEVFAIATRRAVGSTMMRALLLGFLVSSTLSVVSAFTTSPSSPLALARRTRSTPSRSACRSQHSDRCASKLPVPCPTRTVLSEPTLSRPPPMLSLSHSSSLSEVESRRKSWKQLFVALSAFFSSRQQQQVQRQRQHRRFLSDGGRLRQTSQLVHFLLTRFRKGILVVVAASMIWMSASTIHTPTAHASSTTASATSTATERLGNINPSATSKLIHQYVQNHMFDDDQYDPIESMYREAYDDAVKSRYPQALREITSSVLGSSDDTSISATSVGGRSSKGDGGGFGALLTSTIAGLQKRGFSESTSIVILASVFVLAGPAAFLFVGMVFGGISKRNMNSVMKKRYGDTYTVDATMKPEEEVEAPDDDEDDDEDEEEDDDDDDDDDEDDE